MATDLSDRGYRILGRNVRIGRDELDIIAARPRLIVFCEVRARWHTSIETILETVDPKKQQRIRRAASAWLRNRDPSRTAIRFDVAAVRFSAPEPTIYYVEDAF